MRKKDHPLSPQRVSEIRASKQRYLRSVRAGGYGRVAQREQRRLDALNRARDGREE